jgi:phosphate acyltransferase
LSRRGQRPSAETLAGLPVAVDAMGGDRAPDEIVQGAHLAAEAGVPVVLVGPPEQVGHVGDLALVACTEVIGMGENPATAVRRKKDSSMVRTAEQVRDGTACAMVSAGNTGAAMAAALLRLGRLEGVARPCIATPLPRIGRSSSVMVDSGANVECTPAMLVQFAQMGSAYVRERYGVEDPSVALLSNGEEPSKGTPLIKDTHALLAEGPRGVRFVGNVEGRDLLDCPADVVVTDGFTGNVALKSLEGAVQFLFDLMVKVFGTNEQTQAAASVLMEYLAPAAAALDPEKTGGAMLLGVDGLCVISHGSSSATAMGNAIRVAHDLAEGGLVDRLADAVAPA